MTQAHEAAEQSLDEVVTRLTAILRWRARRLFRTVSPIEANGTRLALALLSLRITAHGLRDDSVCGAGFRAGRLTLDALRRSGLEVLPGRDKSGPVEAVLALPRGDQVELWLFLGATAGVSQKRNVETRLVHVQRVLDATGARIQVRLAPDESPVLRESLLAFGALLGGRFPAALQRQQEIELDQLLPIAPTTLSRLCLCLIGQRNVSASKALRRAMLAHSCRALSDADRFCGNVGGLRVR